MMKSIAIVIKNQKFILYTLDEISGNEVKKISEAWIFEDSCISTREFFIFRIGSSKFLLFPASKISGYYTYLNKENILWKHDAYVVLFDNSEIVCRRFETAVEDKLLTEEEIRKCFEIILGYNLFCYFLDDKWIRISIDKSIMDFIKMNVKMNDKDNVIVFKRLISKEKVHN